MIDTRRLLCVFAHPDDECYGPGGSIARYAADGAIVHLLMFTCGEAGSIGVSKELPADELCRRRREELQGACDALGIASHRILGVPDKGVSGADENWAVEQIRNKIDDFRPHVVLTFHHGGVSGHPDHIAVARYLRRAFLDADAWKPLRYFGWGVPPEKSKLYDRPNLVMLPANEIAAVIDIPDDAMDRKIAAIKAHETQIEFYQSLVDTFDYARESRPEFFELRETRLPRPARPLRDLFDGIEAE